MCQSEKSLIVTESVFSSLTMIGNFHQDASTLDADIKRPMLNSFRQGGKGFEGDPLNVDRFQVQIGAQNKA